MRARPGDLRRRCVQAAGCGGHRRDQAAQSLQGPLAPDLVPGVLAKAYDEAGAACLSVLTDRSFSAGPRADLAEARAAVDLPVLRKDFTVGPADVCDARLMGADAVLLIVGALSPGELARSGRAVSPAPPGRPRRSARRSGGGSWHWPPAPT